MVGCIPWGNMNGKLDLPGTGVEVEGVRDEGVGPPGRSPRALKAAIRGFSGAG